MKLAIRGGQLSPQGDLPVEIESISDSGLAVLHAANPPADLHEHLLCDVPCGQTIHFVLADNGSPATLEASLVWMELTNQPRLDLIVDTSDQPGWAALGAAGAPRSEAP
jgi:hypothetical protein